MRRARLLVHGGGSGGWLPQLLVQEGQLFQQILTVGGAVPIAVDRIASERQGAVDDVDAEAEVGRTHGRGQAFQLHLQTADVSVADIAQDGLGDDGAVDQVVSVVLRYGAGHDRRDVELGGEATEVLGCFDPVLEDEVDVPPAIHRHHAGPVFPMGGNPFGQLGAIDAHGDPP